MERTLVIGKIMFRKIYFWKGLFLFFIEKQKNKRKLNPFANNPDLAPATPDATCGLATLGKGARLSTRVAPPLA